MAPSGPKATGGPLAREVRISRVVDGLPPPIATIFRRLIREPRLSGQEMRRRISGYLVAIEARARDVDYIDAELALAIANRCHRLIDSIDDGCSEEHRRLVQAAVSYFVMDDDAEGDTSSLIGFDDDRLVVDRVWTEIGRPVRS